MSPLRGPLPDAKLERRVFQGCEIVPAHNGYSGQWEKEMVIVDDHLNGSYSAMAYTISGSTPHSARPVHKRRPPSGECP
jgi:hypothetical protein